MYIRQDVEVPSSIIRENFAPLQDVLIAGAMGGASADFMMHSLDTVKTRLQGQMGRIRYQNTAHAFMTILKEEGLFRGLYSGIGAAMFGSIPATTIYFGVYEMAKRSLLPHLPETISHLVAGGVGDLMASVIYVPSEVIKTRMQLQGSTKKPHLDRPNYNYKSAPHAFYMICKYDGFQTLYQGYRATILRDIPFSAIQFAVYEKVKLVMKSLAEDRALYAWEEFSAGGISGAMAGSLTTPLDVIKTRMQTQSGNVLYCSVINSFLTIYKYEGMTGLFRGIVPRVLWTIPQSSWMFAIYEQVLHLQSNMRFFRQWPFKDGI